VGIFRGEENGRNAKEIRKARNRKAALEKTVVIKRFQDLSLRYAPGWP
jgi:hypothetical protein